VKPTALLALAYVMWFIVSAIIQTAVMVPVGWLTAALARFFRHLMGDQDDPRDWNGTVPVSRKRFKADLNISP